MFSRDGKHERMLPVTLYFYWGIPIDVWLANAQNPLSSPSHRPVIVPRSLSSLEIFLNVCLFRLTSIGKEAVDENG